MGKKLEHKPERGVFRQYREPGEFRDDMRQIWTNCRLYNAVGTPVRGMVRARATQRGTGWHRLCCAAEVQWRRPGATVWT